MKTMECFIYVSRPALNYVGNKMANADVGEVSWVRSEEGEWG